jgi:anti-sigma-K factor RskA
MNALSDEDRALAGEYAMGLLQGPEAEAARRREKTDLAFAAEVAFWQEQLAGLHAQTDPVTPPARVLDRIERDLFGRRRSFWLQSLLGAGLAAGLAVAALVIVAPPPAPRPDLSAQIIGADGELQVSVAYFDDGDRLVVTLAQGRPAPDRALELWAIAGQAAPVSLGVLPEAGFATIALPPDLAQAGLVLAISDEPPGGSPTGAPTGAVLATAILQSG